MKYSYASDGCSPHATRFSPLEAIYISSSHSCTFRTTRPCVGLAYTKKWNKCIQNSHDSVERLRRIRGHLFGLPMVMWSVAWWWASTHSHCRWTEINRILIRPKTVQREWRNSACISQFRVRLSEFSATTFWTMHIIALRPHSPKRIGAVLYALTRLCKSAHLGSSTSISLVWCATATSLKNCKSCGIEMLMSVN